jgi:serine/threonine-protein kinase
MQPGQMLSHYRLVEKIGEGGMGVVWKALDTTLDREVAVKILPDAFAEEQGRLARFKREAKLLASVNHPNIATIHALEEEDNISFVVLELVEGNTLNELVQQGPLSVENALNVCSQVAAAIETAHERGIIHRDLKPANVMVTPRGKVKVLDFGLAKLREGRETGGLPDGPTATAPLTSPGTVVGTVPYMSPEQVRGKPLDRRTDIWSFGCLLYEALTGRMAFHRDTAPDTLSAILEHEPEWGMLPSETPRTIHTLLTRALEKDVNRRLRDVGDARLEIDDAVSAMAIPRHPADAPDNNRLYPVAVLPFTNMSADPEDEYFSDGVTEEILNALTQLENLRVAARTSSFAFRGPSPDITEVGAKLNVETVLVGSVRRAGNRLRVTAQLINVANGYHLWSERYDRETRDVFAVQDEIAAAVTDTFKSSLLGKRAPLTRLRHTENFEAYELYLKGRYFQGQRVEGLPKATECYRQAVELDTQYALAHAGLAEAFVFLGIYSFLPPREAFSVARKSAASALALDVGLAEAHAALAEINLFHDWEWAAAERGFEKAVALKPQDPGMLIWLSFFHAMLGNFETALPLGERAAEMDPLSLWIQGAFGIELYLARRFEDAILLFEKMIELEPGNSEAYRWGGRSKRLLDRRDEATAWLRQAVKLSGRNPWALADLATALAESGETDEATQLLAELEDRLSSEWIPPMAIMFVHAALGEKDRAFDWLERSHEARGVWLAAMKTDACFDALRSDRRFEQLLRRLDFPVVRQ